MEVLTNPWVIGVGTAVIAGVVAGLILYFVFGIGKSKSRRRQQTTQPTTQQTTTIQEKNHPIPLPVPAQEATSAIAPQDIIKYLDSLPPLQKDSAAEHYKGIKVSWQVNLTSGRNLENGKLRLMMGIKHSIRPWIFCEVDPKQYPLLRVIKETQSFRVDGQIKQVSGSDIELENCQLSF